MPAITVKVPEGSYTLEMKRDLVNRLTDVIVDIEGVPALKPAVTVLIEEIADGGWGSGGHAVTLEQMKQKFGTDTPSQGG
jgi:4-oxalocrotonate tautomerase